MARREVLTDPQTSGGLLIACEASAATGVIDLIRADGFAEAAIIGGITSGAGITVV
jgi:selenide,water dikinase